jgi:hypothetical protein
MKPILFAILFSVGALAQAPQQKDWPNLSRYRMDGASLAANAANSFPASHT